MDHLGVSLLSNYPHHQHSRLRFSLSPMTLPSHLLAFLFLTVSNQCTLFVFQFGAASTQIYIIYIPYYYSHHYYYNYYIHNLLQLLILFIFSCAFIFFLRSSFPISTYRVLYLLLLVLCMPAKRSTQPFLL